MSRRPTLPYTTLPRRFPAEARVVYEGLVDQYRDARLQHDPRDIVAMMLSTVRGCERMTPRDEAAFVKVLRHLNTPPDHGFACPRCYETRFEKILLSSIARQHGACVIATPAKIMVAPHGCNHFSFEAHCKTCDQIWTPSHSMEVGIQTPHQPQVPRKSELN